MRFYLFALALVAAPALSAPPCAISGLPNFSSKSYHVARGLLIDAGFKPLLRKQNPDMSPATEFHALGYFEVCDIGNQATLYAWQSPSGKAFTLTTTHLGKTTIACGLDSCFPED